MEIINRIKAGWPQILRSGAIAIGLIAVFIFVSEFSGAIPLNKDLASQSFGLNERSVLSIGSKSAGKASYSQDSFEPELSARNVASAPIYEKGVVSGNTAENFEVTEYNATIETRRLKEDCAKIHALKALDYVIFENSNEYDDGCGYYFKVESAKREEVLGIIRKMDPKNLAENIQTIKDQIDDYTSEEDILKKKKETIESTLNDAINSYNEIAKIATSQRDAESLARIIDSKIRIIESLTQQRIDISAQLERLGRAKSDQLDRVKFTYFQVNISENKYIDGESLRDSWKLALKEFIVDMNRILQMISIGLIALVFGIIQYGLYLILVAFAAKYAWSFLKKIWLK